jgi:phage gp16-like protein
MPMEDRAVLKLTESGEEAQLIAVKRLLQEFQKQTAEQAGEHAHGQEETWATGDPAVTIRREAASRDNAMKMGMEKQILSPGVKHGEEADLGAEMFGIGSNSA